MGSREGSLSEVVGMPVTDPEGLRLHEAMVVAMIRKRKLSATDEEIAAWNEELGFYRQANGDWPDAHQVRLRAAEYPNFLSVDGTGIGAVIRLGNAGRQNYVSKELTHFLGRNLPTDEDRYQLLVRVLQRGWLTHPPHEERLVLLMELRPGAKLRDHELLNPRVVCFADIPIDQLEIHMKKYSRFGIAFAKDVMVRKRATPVVYVALDAPVLRKKVEYRVGMTLMEDAPLEPDTVDLQVMEAVPRADLFDEMVTEHAMIIKDRHELEQGVELPTAVVEIFRRSTAMDSAVIGTLYNLLKGFDHTLPDDHPNNVYLEREWRVLGNVQFSLDEVSRVILPSAFESRFRAAVPGFAGDLTLV